MSQSADDNQRVITDVDKVKLMKMEKSANWWSRYYASKAKLVNLFYLKYFFKEKSFFYFYRN